MVPPESGFPCPPRGAPFRTDTKQREDNVCDLRTAVPCHLGKLRGLFSEAVSLPFQECVDLYGDKRLPHARHLDNAVPFVVTSSRRLVFSSV